jgi:hypothetical protein
MDGRAFLQAARQLLAYSTEATWRTAAGRAYDALLHEGRASLDRWGFPLLPREDIHAFVRLRFVYTRHPDTVQIGRILEELGRFGRSTLQAFKQTGRGGVHEPEPEMRGPRRTTGLCRGPRGMQEQRRDARRGIRYRLSRQGLAKRCAVAHPAADYC